MRRCLARGMPACRYSASPMIAKPTMPPPTTGASRVMPLAATMRPKAAPAMAMSRETMVRTGSKLTGTPG